MSRLVKWPKQQNPFNSSLSHSSASWSSTRTTTNNCTITTSSCWLLTMTTRVNASRISNWSRNNAKSLNRASVHSLGRLRGTTTSRIQLMHLSDLSSSHHRRSATPNNLPGVKLYHPNHRIPSTTCRTTTFLVRLTRWECRIPYPKNHLSSRTPTKSLKLERMRSNSPSRRSLVWCGMWRTCWG